MEIAECLIVVSKVESQGEYSSLKGLTTTITTRGLTVFLKPLAHLPMPHWFLG
jgi:hypothetical protein